MTWNFIEFEQWASASGCLSLLQAFDVFRASESAQLPRDICNDCICWRVFGTCRQVQVLNLQKTNKYSGECYTNCCPILFFDFIGVKLPELEI